MGRGLSWVIMASVFVSGCGSETTAPDRPLQAARVVTVTVTPGADTVFVLGDSIVFAAEAHDTSGQIIRGKSFSWRSSDTTVAYVAENGTATAIADGAATIIATTDGVAGTATVTVEEFGDLERTQVAVSDSTPVPFQLISVIAPPSLLADSIFAARLDGTPFEFIKFDDSTAVGMIPDHSGGDALLRIVFDKSIAEVPLVIREAAPVVAPRAVADSVVQSVEAGIATMKAALAGEYATGLGPTVEALLSMAKKGIDGLTDEEIRQLASFLLANPLGAGHSGSSAAEALNDWPEGTGIVVGAFLLSRVVAAGAVIGACWVSVAAGPIAAALVCSAAGLFIAVVVLDVEAFMKDVKPFLKDMRASRSGSNQATSGAGASNGQARLAFTSSVASPLVVSGDYGGIWADARDEQSTVSAAFFTALDGVNSVTSRLNAVVAPFGFGQVSPIVVAATSTEQVHAVDPRYLSIDNVSPSSVTYTAPTIDGLITPTFTAEETTEFTFDLVYDATPELVGLSMTVSAIVEVEAPAVAGITAVLPAEVVAGVRTVLTIQGENLQGATLVTVCGYAGVEHNALTSSQDGTAVTVPVTWASSEQGQRCVNLSTPQGGVSGTVTLLAPAPEYSMTMLGTLGGATSSPGDLNNAGQVVGYSQTSDGREHAFLWENGSMTDLTPDARLSYAIGINAHGEIVGAISPENRVNHAILWRGGVAIDLGGLGGTFSLADGINDSGQIVGTTDFDPRQRIDGQTWLWQNEGMTALTERGENAQSPMINNSGQVLLHLNANTPGHTYLWSSGTRTEVAPDTDFENAHDLNDQGHVVGSIGPVPARAFLWTEGGATELGGLGEGVEAYGINNRGQVVGFAYDSQHVAHAVLWHDGVMTILPMPASQWAAAYRINDNGQIVGLVVDDQGRSQAVLWTAR